MDVNEKVVKVNALKEVHKKQINNPQHLYHTNDFNVDMDEGFYNCGGGDNVQNRPLSTTAGGGMLIKTASGSNKCRLRLGGYSGFYRLFQKDLINGTGSDWEKYLTESDLNSRAASPQDIQGLRGGLKNLVKSIFKGVKLWQIN